MSSDDISVFFRNIYIRRAIGRTPLGSQASDSVRYNFFQLRYYVHFFHLDFVATFLCVKDFPCHLDAERSVLILE